MSQQTIELSGIVRNLPDNTVKDGTMQELINLRPRDGALRPVGQKSRTASVPKNVRFIHTISDNIKVFVGTSGNFIAYWVLENGIMGAEKITTIARSDDMSFASLSNSLMVTNNDLAIMNTLVFDINTLSYTVFDAGFPELPTIQLATDPGDLYTYTSSNGVDAATSLAEAIRIVALKSDVALTGPIIVRFAWELVGGTPVKHSAPIYIEASTITQNPSTLLITWTGQYIVLTTSTSAAERTAIKTKYKGIISSLNVYITRMQEVVDDLPDHFFTQRMPKIDSINQYYLVKTIKLEDLDSATEFGGTYLTGPISGDFTDLTTREVMDTDNFSHNTLFAKSLFSYNSRVFLGLLINNLYKGNNFRERIAPLPSLQTGPAYDLGMEFDIATSGGLNTVFSGWVSFDYYDNSATHPAFYITNYLTYPDARAQQARLYARQNGIIYLLKPFKLTAQTNFNFSYNDESNVPGGKYGISGPFTGFPIATLTTVKDTYIDYNRIQATELNNPFHFPAINSYRVGNGTILGMSTNAVALSQGQFGQFPIFCFTTDGIWTMNIGSGETLINTITPLSRHVCNNPSSITPIDGGTAFTTTKGLFIISGTEAIEISDLAEGKHNSRITGTLNYEAIANNPNLYQIKNYLCAVPFLTYISGAKIAWDHAEDHKELIVSNSAYNYSWVYNLKHKMWFKISQVWDNFVSDYPRTYGYRAIDTSFYQDDLTEEDFSEYIPVHIETRPLKLIKGAFKMINRILVQGDLSQPESPFSLNLFGSVNNITWHLMNNGRILANGNLPLLLGRTTFSCRYFILVLGGKVDEDFYLTHVDIDFDERYGNKLR